MHGAIQGANYKLEQGEWRVLGPENFFECSFIQQAQAVQRLEFGYQDRLPQYVCTRF